MDLRFPGGIGDDKKSARTKSQAELLVLISTTSFGGCMAVGNPRSLTAKKEGVEFPTEGQ